MPLSLDSSTDRAQLVTWDPGVGAEEDEAKARILRLLDQGFVLDRMGLGEARLNPPARDPNLGVLRVLSQNGDDRIVWDRRNPGEVREASQKFHQLRAQGYQAYAARADGKRGHTIDMFDPGLEEVILVPAGHLVPG